MASFIPSGSPAEKVTQAPSSGDGPTGMLLASWQAMHETDAWTAPWIESSEAAAWVAAGWQFAPPQKAVLFGCCPPVGVAGGRLLSGRIAAWQPEFEQEAFTP